ncbi:unnamed protein product, partial [Amoebophrya sp. A25]|eukprot:GSA25T00017487001.1
MRGVPRPLHLSRQCRSHRSLPSNQQENRGPAHTAHHASVAAPAASHVEHEEEDALVHDTSREKNPRSQNFCAQEQGNCDTRKAAVEASLVRGHLSSSSSILGACDASVVSSECSASTWGAFFSAQSCGASVETAREASSTTFSSCQAAPSTQEQGHSRVEASNALTPDEVVDDHIIEADPDPIPNKRAFLLAKRGSEVDELGVASTNGGPHRPLSSARKRAGQRPPADHTENPPRSNSRSFVSSSSFARSDGLTCTNLISSESARRSSASPGLLARKVSPGKQVSSRISPNRNQRSKTGMHHVGKNSFSASNASRKVVDKKVVSSSQPPNSKLISTVTPRARQQLVNLNNKAATNAGVFGSRSNDNSSLVCGVEVSAILAEPPGQAPGDESSSVITTLFARDQPLPAVSGSA